MGASDTGQQASTGRPPPPFEDAKDYDTERTSMAPARRAASVGAHLGKRGLGFTRRHMLMTAVVGGGLITGIGLPAIGVLYAGGKMMKMATRGPRTMLTKKAQGIYQDQQAKHRELQEALYGPPGGSRTPSAEPAPTSRSTHTPPETKMTIPDDFYESYDPDDDMYHRQDPAYGRESIASRQPRPPIEASAEDAPEQQASIQEPAIVRATLPEDVPSRQPIQTSTPSPVRSPLADRQISLDTRDTFERIKAENKAMDEARVARKAAESRQVRAQTHRINPRPGEDSNG